MEQINRKSNIQLFVFAIIAASIAHLGAAPHSSSSTYHHHPTTTTTTTTTEHSEQTVTANTTSGLLRGIKLQTIIKFLAVPYAEAPTGSLRFKRPVEYRRQQELNASQYGKTCPQYRHLTQFISPLLNIDANHQTSEDCLRLNVFVPASVGPHHQNGDYQLEPNKQLPVIVWIPGEGFDFADARQFDGTHLAQKTQSIVVTVQYRVGVLGFLHAPKLNITGNMGVYDQLMALRWVNKNIRTFGGDSERVTLMGRFSGSMSISAMITAPRQQELLHENETKQLLFQRVALLSGIAVEDWIIDSSQHERVAHLEESALARSYCTGAQVEDGSCLSSMSVEQLMRISDYGWRLVKDNELIGEQTPIEAIKSSEFASTQLEGILLGETGMEGTLCLYRHALHSGSSNYAQLIDEDKLTSQDLYNVIRDDSQTYFRYNPNKTNPIEMALGSLIEQTTADQPSAGAAADQQQQQQTADLKLREKYLNACSAYMVKSHSNRFKRNILTSNQLLENRMNSNKRPTEVYHYELRYKPSFSLAPDYIRTAAHGDDIPMIFGLIHNQPRNEINEADLVMTRKMMSYIGNFVHGNQPLLAPTSQSASVVSVDSEDDSVDSVAINMKPRSWASDGQLHHIEFDESDMQELNARANQRHRQRQSANGLAANNGAAEEAGGDKSSVRGDKSLIIRLLFVDSINQQQQQQQPQQQPQQQESNHLFVQRRQQRQQLSSSQPPIAQQQQQQVLPAQQTNMTLINESSFVTMLLFGTCLVLFALMSTCLGLCLIIFRGSGPHQSFGGKSTSAAVIATGHDHHHQQQLNQQQQQRYVNHSSTSSCNICEDSQVGNANSIDAVLRGQGGEGGARCKADDAHTFSNVFAKLSRNQTSQSQQQPIDGQSRNQQHKQTE